jgi:hypothetical protein
MRGYIVALAFVISAGASNAEQVSAWMPDAEIKTAFAGVTIDGIYADNSLFTETYGSDGRLAYRDMRGALAGRWSVVNGAFCTLYDSMITGGCFRVTRHSANCYEFYFVATKESEAAADLPKTPRWTARGWDKSKAATCDENPAA